MSEVYGTMGGVTTRQPRWVYDEGDEPDPRFSLANERTFLAWVRTALAMLAGGVALHALEVPSTDWLRTVVVVALIAAQDGDTDLLPLRRPQPADSGLRALVRRLTTHRAA